MNTDVFRIEPGWTGAFTRAQADGAWPNGTRVEKILSDASDAHVDGAQGTILGSFGVEGHLFYFVEWDDQPRVACGIAPFRVRQLGGNQ